VLVLMVILTVVGVVRMAQIQNRLDHVVSVNNVVTRLVVDMRNNVSERVTSLRTLTLMTDPADMEPELNRFKEQTGKYDALQQKLAEKFAIEASAEEKSPAGPDQGCGRRRHAGHRQGIGTVPGQQRDGRNPRDGQGNPSGPEEVAGSAGSAG
jgi:hypothetical protein